MSIYTATYVLLATLVVIGFGKMELWQRIVSLLAIALVITVLVVAHS